VSDAADAADAFYRDGFVKKKEKKRKKDRAGSAVSQLLLSLCRAILNGCYSLSLTSALISWTRILRRETQEAGFRYHLSSRFCPSKPEEEHRNYL